jgi:hypothetical protein
LQAAGAVPGDAGAAGEVSAPVELSGAVAAGVVSVAGGGCGGSSVANAVPPATDRQANAARTGM